MGDSVEIKKLKVEVQHNGLIRDSDGYIVTKLIKDYGKTFEELKDNNYSPIEDLLEALKEDDGYRLGWVANLACAFQDAYQSSDDKSDIHKISNKGAEIFLERLGG